jgi:hypothetical protein
MYNWHLQTADFTQQDRAMLIELTLRSRSITLSLEKIMSQLTDAVQNIVNDAAANRDGVAAATTAFQGLTKQLADAILALQNNGVPPDQLQPLLDAHATFQTAIAALATAVQPGVVTPAPVVPPVAGATTAATA